MQSAPEADARTLREGQEATLQLLARALEKLGFQRRERFYAGSQAGWGAQILEQPVEGIVVFADVDLMPEEVETDFSRQALPPATRVGTVPNANHFTAIAPLADPQSPMVSRLRELAAG